ncbi:MAG: ribonuclease P protein component [Deltaproteobacteria bacterium]|nr:ribonuclease P protein component [Deltaproteobacteria bacterium]
MTPRGRLHRSDRVLLRRDFEQILRRGRRRRGDHLGIAVLRREDDTRRIGLAVSRGCGHSPARARMRRLLREAFRALRADWPGIDLVVTCGRPWPDAHLPEVAAELERLVAGSLARRGRRDG